MSDTEARVVAESPGSLLASTGQWDRPTGGAQRDPWIACQDITAPPRTEERSDNHSTSPATNSPTLIILKLGGSILTGDADLSLAVHEIYRHFRAGRRVIAVVSAQHGTTDRLLSRARRFTDAPSDAALASLLSTGELTSAALLTLACERSGLPARTLDPAQIHLRAAGPALDASPTSVNTSTIHAALNNHPILIIPGFIARDDLGNPVLLGRGGSDLTALFLARELRAPCRLIKDVPGIYETDPNAPSVRARAEGRASPSPRRYQSLSFADLDSLNSKVVQPRTATFARENQIEFEVGAPLSDHATRIGPATALLKSDPPFTTPGLRIALLGHGTVGAGVARAIRRFPDTFTLTSVAVRTLEKHTRDGLPRHLLTTDPFAAIATDADLVIELFGGLNPAYELIKQSLASGKHVITANKAVIARHGDELRSLAAAAGVQLLYSAAVGGALPILETARRLHEAKGVSSLEAILNGATNYILSRIQQGITFAEALAETQSRGLTEADPTRDLSGQDALDKLTVIAQDLWPDLPVRAAVVPLPPNPAPGTRQIARLEHTRDAVFLQIIPEVPPPSSPLARCVREHNTAVFTTADGCQHTLTGKGAGRYPTTESVIADLLDLARSNRPAITSASC
ncbi:MAG: hypothetical protein KF678_03355 [Phycisphaeraceae bacterium]|nr:hypothetical protein [Phycisphaeraceae bacterium]